MRGRSMMKWRVRRDSHCSPTEHDDIRRSIEVLDSVLAEFDDCLESWETSTSHYNDATYGKSQLTDINSNTVKPSGPTGVQLECQTTATDGSTSHFPSDIVPEQSRVGSPPPIPKRSPATKLSDVSQFTFPTSNDSLSDSHHETDLSSPHVQPQQRITLSDNSSSDKCRDDKCANCGRGLKGIANMEQKSIEETSISPFHHRKQMFEANIAQANRSPSLNRSYGTSFKRQQIDDVSNVSDESGFSELSRSQLSDLSGSISPKMPSRMEIAYGHHSVKCSCKDRIRQLNAKFADVRRLLKLNKIRGLNNKPPSFVPPPPPALVITKQKCSPNAFRKLSDSSHTPKTSTNDSSMDYAHQVGNESLSSSVSSLIDFKLCNRCTSSLSIHTIEDLPKLLPTDALHRPHLGFSYSMEEDLPPGVKEIRQTTSTPKDHHVSSSSSPRIFRNKESNLSTFSHSANSLGYISSQSDMELNDLSTIPDKVPMSSFKSRTLPNGLDRSPFYSGDEDIFDYEGTRGDDPKSHHKSSVLLVDPPEEKAKNKHFRVFSRKVKKDKKKNGATP